MKQQVSPTWDICCSRYRRASGALPWPLSRSFRALPCPSDSMLSTKLVRQGRWLDIRLRLQPHRQAARQQHNSSSRMAARNEEVVASCPPRGCTTSRRLPDLSGAQVIPLANRLIIARPDSGPTHRCTQWLRQWTPVSSREDEGGDWATTTKEASSTSKRHTRTPS